MPDHKKIRFAIVGLGHLAQVAVLPAFRNLDNAEIDALITGDRRKGKTLARRYGVEDVYEHSEYEQCLDGGIDAVYIVMPNHLHCAHGAGCHGGGSRYLRETYGGECCGMPQDDRCRAAKPPETHDRLSAAFRKSQSGSDRAWAWRQAREVTVLQFGFRTAGYRYEFSGFDLKISHQKE